MNQIQKVLIVDDDRTNQKILTTMLKDDYEIELASSGEEALAVTKSFIPDIVLLDIMMPGIDGYEVCRQFRLDEKLAQSKIMLVTAKDGLNNRLNGYQVGADDYIQKPFDEDELLAKVSVFTRLNNEEKKLKQLNRRLLLRQQDIPNTLWDCDSELTFTYVDNHCERIIGFTSEELIGKSISSFIKSEEIGEFFLKFKEKLNVPVFEIHGLNFSFKTKEGEYKTLQIFANRIEDEFEKPSGLTGVFRDMNAFTQIIDSVTIEKGLTVHINQTGKLVYFDEGVRQYLTADPDNPEKEQDFLKFLIDPSFENLIQFSFNQKEDVPFPVEVKLIDEEENRKDFTVQFLYNNESDLLEGQLVPVSVGGKLDLVSDKMESQQKKIDDQTETLKQAVVIDSDMRESILTDAENLSDEILSLTKSLEAYAFPIEGPFSLESFSQFILNRNLQIYSENLRLLGNKIHGLKGSCGFLNHKAKELCHKVEDITRALAENSLLLTNDISQLLKQFIFRIEEILEQLQEDPMVNISIDDWTQKIERAFEQGKAYLGQHAHTYAKFVTERSVDNGEIRSRKKDEYLSVSMLGYEDLAERVKELFYSLSESISEDKILQANTIYNQFLSTHQEIKKVPLNLSRYERLIPKIAEEYNKEAEFIFKDYNVKADREFWNSIHEILNHVLKNAVIHGIESPEERKDMGKNASGKVTVSLQEDALHILLSVSDDGRGVNIEKIIEKAIENKVHSRDKLQQLSEAAILDLLFIQGISTAESLDDNAGRGVGMNAVQEAMNHHQGICQIENHPGKGCSWNFSFSKSNVSLPCIIVSIEDLSLAFPEDYVESFVDFEEKNILTVQQTPAYQYENKAIPMIDTGIIFDKEAKNDKIRGRSVMILENNNRKFSLVINDILHHAILPVLPLPAIYRDIPIYLGITIYNSEPVQVIDISGIC